MLKQFLFYLVYASIFLFDPVEAHLLVQPHPPCADGARELSRISNSEKRELRKAQAIQKIYQLIRELKRKPTNLELKAIGVPVDQWKGIGIFRPKSQRSLMEDKEGPRAHLRWNDNIEQAWAPILLLLTETTSSDAFTEAQIHSVIEEIEREIRTSWPTERLRQWSDERVVAFILEHKRLPRNYKRAGEMDFETMGIDYEKWSGTGSYRPNSQNRMHELALHQTPFDAWHSVYVILKKSLASREDAEEYRLVIQQMEEKIGQFEQRVAPAGFFESVLQRVQETYLIRRGDLASEDPVVQAKVVEELKAQAWEAVRHYEVYGPALAKENEETQIGFAAEAVIRRLQRSTLTKIEEERLTEFYPLLIKILWAQNKHLIHAANFRSFFSGNGRDAEIDLATEVVDDHLTTFFLKGVFDRNRKDVSSRDAKLYFLIDILRNKLLDRLRAHMAASRSGSRPHYELNPSVAGEDSPDEPLFIRRDHPLLQQAIERLPENQQWIIHLFYFHGKTQREISELLEIPIGTVKSSMSRAMVRLARDLRDSGYNPDD